MADAFEVPARGVVARQIVQRRDRLAARNDLPLLAGIVAVVAWGVGPLFIRGMSVSFGTIVFYRLWAGVVVMITMARMTGGSVDRATMRVTWLPGIFFGTSMVFGFWSFQETSIANATIIGAMTPAIILVAAAKLYGERRSGAQLVGAAAGFAGVAIVVIGAGGTGGATLKGDLLAAVNLVLWCVYLLVTKRVRAAGMHAGSYIASIFLWSAIVVTPWCLAVSDDLGAMTFRDVLLVLGMCLIPGLVGHSLMSWAQSDLDVSIVSLLGLANPVVAAVGAWIVYDQSLNGWQYLGSVLVLAGLASVVADQRATVRLEPRSGPRAGSDRGPT